MEIGNKDNLPEEDWDLYPESAGGLPQGGYLSPLFSNIYLSDFDHTMIKNKYKLIRYADDFIVMCKTLEEAEGAYILTRYMLEDLLGLEMHPRVDKDKKARTRIIKITQTTIQFLGVHFNGVRIWPDSEKRKRLSEKLAAISSSSKNVLELLTKMRNLMEGWVAAYGFTDLNTTYVKLIDDEVNRILWLSLKKFGWKLKPNGFLANTQREKSGVGPIAWHLDKVRGNFDESDRDIFTKYWSQ
jgi:RNA-directed DNA polymerase